jgi:hypothetical protein
MNLMRAVIVFIALLSLAGCAGHGPTRDYVGEADDAKCRSYGAKPGTDAYVACRSRIGAARQNDNSPETDFLLSQSVGNAFKIQH